MRLTEQTWPFARVREAVDSRTPFTHPSKDLIMARLPIEARMVAMENVLQETRLTLDGTLLALAGVLSNVPGIADDLRQAAAFTTDAPVSETDPAYRERVVASRAHTAAIINAMADTVAANAEKSARFVIVTGAGLQ